jgi:hypothetical protein
MPAEEDMYVLYASASRLVNDLRSKGLVADMWKNMLTRAFDNKDVGALNTVIQHLRAKLDIHQGGPAAAVPSPHVPSPAPPANSAPAVHPAPSNSLPLPLNTVPPSEPLDRADSDSLPQPPNKRRRTRCGGGNSRLSDEFFDIFTGRGRCDGWCGGRRLSFRPRRRGGIQ